MAWLTGLLKRNRGREESQYDSIRRELLDLGIDIDMPELVRSDSSTSNFSSTSDLSEGSRSLHEETTKICETNSRQEAEELLHHPSLLQVLLAVYDEVEHREYIQETGAVSNMKRSPFEEKIISSPCTHSQEAEALSTAKRSVCPQAICKTHQKSEETIEVEESIRLGRAKMRTFPSTSFRKPCEVAQAKRSVTFSHKVHVLEYQPDIVQYSSPEWVNIFSYR